MNKDIRRFLEEQEKKPPSPFSMCIDYLAAVIDALAQELTAEREQRKKLAESVQPFVDAFGHRVADTDCDDDPLDYGLSCGHVRRLVAAISDPAEAPPPAQDHAQPHGMPPSAVNAPPANPTTLGNVWRGETCPTPEVLAAVMGASPPDAQPAREVRRFEGVVSFNERASTREDVICWVQIGDKDMHELLAGLDGTRVRHTVEVLGPASPGPAGEGAKPATESPFRPGAIVRWRHKSSYRGYDGSWDITRRATWLEVPAWEIRKGDVVKVVLESELAPVTIPGPTGEGGGK